MDPGGIFLDGIEMTDDLGGSELVGDFGTEFPSSEGSSELIDPAFKKRLATLVGAEQPFSWAVRVGIPRATFSRIWNEGAPPRAEHLRRIHQVTGVSIDWLLTGEGPMRRGKAAREAARSIGASTDSDEFDYLPLYNVAASGGHGTEAAEPSRARLLAFRRDWVRQQLRATPAELYLLYVEGDSMEPTLSDGDIVMLRRAEGSPRDGIYVLRIGSALHVKRLQFLGGGEVEVSSDNRTYKAFSIRLEDPGEQVEIVGRVVWAGRKL